MKWIHVLAGAALGLLLITSGCETLKLVDEVTSLLGTQQGLTMDTIVGGLKEALVVGTRNTVASTGKEGGYSNNSLIRIALPQELQTFGDTLRKVGLGKQVDLFEQKMNVAAEDAARAAAPIFVDAVKQMSFADAKAILYGSNTAATDYFRERTSETLRAQYSGVVATHMNSLGVVRKYNDLMARYNMIPLVPKPTFDPEEYVTDQALNGLFAVLATEEQKIRENPAARTTALLRQVFGSR